MRLSILLTMLSIMVGSGLIGMFIGGNEMDAIIGLVAGCLIAVAWADRQAGRK